MVSTILEEPPLADYDRTEILVKRAFPVCIVIFRLDPRSHTFIVIAH